MLHKYTLHVQKNTTFTHTHEYSIMPILFQVSLDKNGNHKGCYVKYDLQQMEMFK